MMTFQIYNNLEYIDTVILLFVIFCFLLFIYFISIYFLNCFINFKYFSFQIKKTLFRPLTETNTKIRHKKYDVQNAIESNLHLSNPNRLNLLE